MRMAKVYLIRLAALGLAGIGLYLADQNAEGPVKHTWPMVVFGVCMFTSFWLIVGTAKGGRFHPKKQ